MENKKRHCPNCGAPITTEICPYCHVDTGINTKDADMEYPVIDCKEAAIGFWNFIFPMIFAVGFGFAGFEVPIILILSGLEGALAAVLFCSIFGLIGIVALIIAITPVIRYLLIKNRGKEIEAVVYGYIDDNILLNDRPAQIVKLLVNTDEGYRFILYQLADIKKPYKINSKINLLVYKDIFLIVKNKKYYF